MKYTSTSEIGLVRQKNQDCVSVVENENALLAIVCDGIGGARAGEIASALTVRAFQESFIGKRKFTDLKDVETWFDQTVERANTEVYQQALSNEAYHGMGTTLALVIVLSGKAIGFNVGDSRIYEYRKGTLHSLSHDQTYAYEMYLRNEIPLEAVFNHPKRNILMNAIGIEESIQYEKIAIKKGWDMLLMSSDGLHDYVEHSLIENAMSEGSLVQKRDALLQLSYEAGGYDNISIVILVGDDV